MSTNDVHVFVPKFRVDETLEQIRECLEHGWTGLGFKTVEFEETWKAYSGFPHAHFLNSATAGLHLAVEVLKRRHGWGEGDEVITTPLTFVSTNHAILYAGLRPVFADIDETLCLDPASILDRITDRTRAVMFVGVGGNTGRYTEVVQLCRERGLALILDAAHMAGTKHDGVQVGHDADVAVFSFQAVKNLPTADSGMVCFTDPENDATARRLSWMGISQDTYTRTVGGGAYKWRYDVDELGWKYNGNSVMAAMALVGLKYLDDDNTERRRLAVVYDWLLATTIIRGVPMSEGSSRHLYQVLVPNRDETIVRMNAAGIYPGVHYRDNSQYGIYREYAGHTPRAAQASEEIISLPLHLGMTDADVHRVVDALTVAIR